MLWLWGPGPTLSHLAQAWAVRPWHATGVWGLGSIGSVQVSWGARHPCPSHDVGAALSGPWERRHQSRLLASWGFAVTTIHSAQPDGDFLTHPVPPFRAPGLSTKMRGGTGQKFEAAATVIAGVASLAATLLSIVYGTRCLAQLCVVLL